ncbi:hypothetical protein F183_A45380 [Bryobacterales bacterium F-183]|nr:hypothetical protein F183_A45380 [Bryobacterales bacterium F-183]
MNRRTVTAAAVTLALATAWLIAQQQAQTTKALPDLIPPGALLTLEARDANALITSWNASPEKKTWVSSSAYQTYIRSKLALRLDEVQNQYATGLGVSPDLALLENIAGGDAAVAVYDIGKLEMLYLTRLPQARAADNLLTRARTKFQQRNAAGQSYYTKATTDGTVAFAIVGDLLVLATREDLVANSLTLLRNGGTSLRQERWYTDAAAAAVSQNAPDVRLTVHMERTVRTPHFRSYWIQQNITDLKAYTATVSDLYFGQADVTEKRTLVRAEPQTVEANTQLAALLPYLPSDAGFTQSWARPQAAVVQYLIRQQIAPQLQASGAAPQLYAPGETQEQQAGDEGDLEQRIDTEQPVLLQNGVRQLPIVQLGSTAPVVAAAKVAASRTLADGVFTGIDSAVVLLRGQGDWDRNSIDRALRDSGVEPSGLEPVHVLIDGKILALSNSKPLLDRIAAKRGNTAAAAAPGVTHTAVYRHATENAQYARLMRMLDFPKLPTTTPRPPMLFSETIASIGDVLGRVETVTMETKDEGNVVRQSVVYQRKRS